jgi:hypothetical protein
LTRGGALLNWIEIPAQAAKEILNTLLFDYRFLLVYVVLIWLIKTRYDRYMVLQDHIYGRNVRDWRHLVEEIVFYGLILGFLFSIGFIAMNITIGFESIKYLFVITVFLGLINIRLVRLHYAAGILVLIGLVFNIKEFINPGLLVIAAVLSLAEAVLVRFNTSKDIYPVFIKHEEGIVGAFLIRKFWILPVVFLSFTAGQDIFDNTAGYITGSLSALSLDCILGFCGYTDIAFSRQPEEKIAKTSFELILFSFLILTTAVFSLFIPAFVIITVLLLLIGHEGIMFYEYYVERKRTPLFIPAKRGLMVFDILPESHAFKMGINRGDVILGINNKDIQTEQGLAEALKDYPSFVWVHLLDNNGKEKTLSYRAYPDGFNDLGIVCIPREKEVTYNIDHLENLVIIKNLVARFRKTGIKR